MWRAYQRSKSYQRRASEDLSDDEGEPLDSLTAYCVDEVVLWFGARVESDLAETVEVGMGADKRREPKYTLPELLDPAFRVPRPTPTPKKPSQIQINADAWAMASQSSLVVKRWRAIPPS